MGQSVNHGTTDQSNLTASGLPSLLVGSTILTYDSFTVATTTSPAERNIGSKSATVGGGGSQNG